MKPTAFKLDDKMKKNSSSIVSVDYTLGNNGLGKYHIGLKLFDREKSTVQAAVLRHL